VSEGAVANTGSARQDTAISPARKKERNCCFFMESPLKYAIITVGLVFLPRGQGKTVDRLHFRYVTLGYNRTFYYSRLQKV
jgi:hypothetical protein